jgi:hypothetical protein
MFAPATTAPVGSVTLPDRLPRTDCATAPAVKKNIATRTATPAHILERVIVASSNETLAKTERFVVSPVFVMHAAQNETGFSALAKPTCATGRILCAATLDAP